MEAFADLVSDINDKEHLAELLTNFREGIKEEAAMIEATEILKMLHEHNLQDSRGFSLIRARAQLKVDLYTNLSGL